MNTVFHVTAALGLGALLWLYVQAQNTSRWLVEWLADGAGTVSRVRVDRPSRYLERLAHALHWEADVQSGKTEALRPMRGGGMMALMISFGVRSIFWRGAGPNSHEKLEIRTFRPVADIVLWRKRLALELGCAAGAEVLFTCQGEKS